MARALWNVRYRGSYNPGDKRDGVKTGMFWLEETADPAVNEARAREAANAWKAANPDVHLIVAVWPAVLFDGEELLREPEPPKPVVTRSVSPIPTRAA